MESPTLLERLGATSPMVPALSYVAVVTVVDLVTGLAPKSGFLAFLGILVWLAAALFLFGVVTWLRDDDWLAAGFLIGLTVMLGGLFATVVARIVTTGSIGEAVFIAAGAPLNLLLRAIVAVPLCGAVVKLARMATEWLMGELSGPGARSAGMSSAKRRTRAETRR